MDEYAVIYVSMSLFVVLYVGVIAWDAIFSKKRRKSSKTCPECGSSDISVASRVWNMSCSETTSCICKSCGHRFSVMRHD